MAVRTTTEFQTEVDTLLADNTEGNISAADVRSVFTDVKDSFNPGDDSRLSSRAQASIEQVYLQNVTATFPLTVNTGTRTTITHSISSSARNVRTESGYVLHVVAKITLQGAGGTIASATEIHTAAGSPGSSTGRLATHSRNLVGTGQVTIPLRAAVGNEDSIQISIESVSGGNISILGIRVDTHAVPPIPGAAAADNQTLSLTPAASAVGLGIVRGNTVSIGRASDSQAGVMSAQMRSQHDFIAPAIARDATAETLNSTNASKSVTATITDDQLFQITDQDKTLHCMGIVSMRNNDDGTNSSGVDLAIHADSDNSQQGDTVSVTVPAAGSDVQYRIAVDLDTDKGNNYTFTATWQNGDSVRAADMELFMEVRPEIPEVDDQDVLTPLQQRRVGALLSERVAIADADDGHTVTTSSSRNYVVSVPTILRNAESNQGKTLFGRAEINLIGSANGDDANVAIIDDDTEMQLGSEILEVTTGGVFIGAEFEVSDAASFTINISNESAGTATFTVALAEIVWEARDYPKPFTRASASGGRLQIYRHGEDTAAVDFNVSDTEGVITATSELDENEFVFRIKEKLSDTTDRTDSNAANGAGTGTYNWFRIANRGLSGTTAVADDTDLTAMNAGIPMSGGNPAVRPALEHQIVFSGRDALEMGVTDAADTTGTGENRNSITISEDGLYTMTGSIGMRIWDQGLAGGFSAWSINADANQNARLLGRLEIRVDGSPVSVYHIPYLRYAALEDMIPTFMPATGLNANQVITLVVVAERRPADINLNRLEFFETTARIRLKRIVPSVNVMGQLEPSMPSTPAQLVLGPHHSSHQLVYHKARSATAPAATVLNWTNNEVGYGDLPDHLSYDYADVETGDDPAWAQSQNITYDVDDQTFTQSTWHVFIVNQLNIQYSEDRFTWHPPPVTNDDIYARERDPDTGQWREARQIRGRLGWEEIRHTLWDEMDTSQLSSAGAVFSEVSGDFRQIDEFSLFMLVFREGSNQAEADDGHNVAHAIFPRSLVDALLDHPGNPDTDGVSTDNYPGRTFYCLMRWDPGPSTILISTVSPSGRGGNYNKQFRMNLSVNSNNQLWYYTLFDFGDDRGSGTTELWGFAA